MLQRALFWLAIVAAWSVLVVVFAVSSSLTYALNYQPPRWGYTLTMAATEWYVWAAFTPFVAWLARRLRFSRRWMQLPILIVAGLPVAFFKVTLTRVLRGVTDNGGAYFQLNDLVVQYLIYAAIVFFTYVWLYYRAAQERELRTSQLEALLAETRLQMLSMQLQPHFLFNTLNTIAELVHQQPEAAEQMIAGLSHLLRESLHAGVAERVPIEQELVLLGRYIDIQRARFGDRLHVETAVAADAAGALVPGLLLQPLVENAIKHGIGARAGDGHIEVRARRAHAALIIEVIDDGRGIGAKPPGEGVGLGNCRSRLRSLFGDAGSIDIRNRDSGGCVVTIRLPFETARIEATARLRESASARQA